MVLVLSEPGVLVHDLLQAAHVCWTDLVACQLSANIADSGSRLQAANGTVVPA